jgi:polyisoprenoid-binding protein YceI
MPHLTTPLKMKKILLPLLLGAVLAQASAAPVNYKIDPAHTFPSFEADHMGISVWRGKFNTNSGTVTLDKAAKTGSIAVEIDMASVDFGHEALNTWATGKDFFDAAKFGPAQYKGKLTGFRNGKPTQVVGTLTMRGITRPVNLKLNLFKCIPHPIFKRELCGADAVATIKRDDFGLVAGKDYGFKMDVALRIQVEALAEE